MGVESKIQWTQATWNIARGCTKIDDDCKYCYMYRESLNGTRYNPIKIVRTKTVFDLPLRLKEPSLIFTSSLTDFFHEAIDAYRHEAWNIIRQCPQHTFQILTKRPERIINCLPPDWGQGYSNVWLGTSVGHALGYYRIGHLENTNSLVRFLSIEPLHEELDLHFQSNCMNYNCADFGPCRHCIKPDKIHWVIVGGESGNAVGKYKYRECRIEWIESIISQCIRAGVPVFVKQLGTHIAKQMGLKDRHGGNIDEWPAHLQIRQMPNN